jgi:hypothetical protein
MPRTTKKPPEEPKAQELGKSQEERNRHLRYAHEQYSGSGQGRFGAPKGRNLPLQEAQEKQQDYPPGTKMPWPSDETIERETKPRPRRLAKHGHS